MDYTKYITISKGEVSRLFSFFYDKHMDEDWKTGETLDFIKLLILSNENDRNEILSDIGETWDSLMEGVDR